MMPTTTRVLRGAAAAIAIVATAAACEIPPPPPVFTVTTTADGNDADPGDGVCEVTPGVGNCSLRAAVQEANAGTGARLVLPADANFDLSVVDGDGHNDLDIESAITIDPVHPTSRIRSPGSNRVVDIAEGASLDGSGLGIERIRVAGALVLESYGIGEALEGTMLEVTATGDAVLGTGGFGAFGTGSPIVNAGTLTIVHSSIKVLSTSTLITTTGDGSTRLAATRLLKGTVLTSGYYPIAGGSYCSGNPIESLGYNYSPTTDCNLTAPGDIAGASYGTVDESSPWASPTLFEPAPADSPVRGAIPEGTLECGGKVPATDGACDIGPY